MSTDGSIAMPIHVVVTEEDIAEGCPKESNIMTKYDPLPSIITINVTEDDIASGRPMCATRCPIALSAGRAMRRLVSIGVCQIFDFASGEEISRLPDAARRFIWAVDHGYSVKPFSFTVATNDYQVEGDVTT